MNNYSATLYSHSANFDLITLEAKKLFPKAEWEYERKNEFTFATLTIKNGLLAPKKQLQIGYRERNQLGYELKEPSCPVSNNLSGMYNLVKSINTTDELIRSKLLAKIETINAEFTITMKNKAEKEFRQLVEHLAGLTGAIVFAQPRTGMMNSLQQAWLDKDLNLILDMEGNSNVDDLEVKIESRFFDGDTSELPEQIQRKNRSELTLRKYGIPVNEKLPAIPAEDEIKFRSPKEIAERITALALTNLVAFNNITGEQALQFANKHEITNLLSPKEIEFLRNPTDEKKHHETWKCEGIWTLSWAINIVETLPFPDQLVDLSNIPEDLYPIGSSVSPQAFLSKIFHLRSTEEILDANDLYYRIDWACVDKRLKKESMETVHPGVVYERHYALNWLINYRNQKWDQVTTDT